MATNYSSCTSVLGPILFNISINDLLLFIKEREVFSFAGNTTLYKCGRDLDIVSEHLEMDDNIAIDWLNNTKMVEKSQKVRTYVLR